MKRLAVTMLLTLSLATCLVAMAYAGEPTEKLLGDSPYWSSFAWDHPEKSSLFTSVPWTKESMRQFEVFQYTYQMDLQGLPVVLYALRKSADITGFGDFDIAYKTFDKKESADVFVRLLQWCKTNFGEQSARVDDVKRVYKVQSFTTSYSYWRKGATLIRLTTSDVIEKGIPTYLIRISYFDARHNKVRPPEKVLSCDLDVSRLDKELAGMFPRKANYKFDEEDGVIKNLDDTVVSDDVVSNETYLTFSKQTDTLLKEHIFNKSTGEYRFTLFNSRNTNRRVPDVVIPGKCTLTEPELKP